MDETRDDGQDDRDFYNAMESDEITDVGDMNLNLAASQSSPVEGRPIDADCGESQQAEYDFKRVTYWGGKRKLDELNPGLESGKGESDNLVDSAQNDIIVIKPTSINADRFFKEPRLRLENLMLHCKSHEVVKITPNVKKPCCSDP